VLHHRQFLIFLASSTAGNVGYAVYAISIPWLTYSVTHSYEIVGVALFIELASYAGVFLVGPVVDRSSNQRTIFLWCYPPMAVAALMIGIGATHGFLTIPLLLALVAVVSILWDFVWAADIAAPGILLSTDEQFAAQGISGAVGGTNAIAGYAAGGSLIFVVGPSGGLYLYAILLVVGAALAVPLKIVPPPHAPESFSKSFWDGWKVVAGGRGRPFLQLGIVDGIQGFFLAAPALYITLFAETTFHTSAFAYSLLFVCEVVGGAAAGWAFGSWNPRSRVGPLLGATLIAVAAAVAVAAGAPAWIALEAVAWFAIGFTWSSYTDVKYAFLRGAIPPGQLARATSNLWLFPGISSAAGALVLGSLASSSDPRMFGLVVMGGLLAAGILALAMPAVRSMKY
jgi:hypothetical protein